MNILPFICGLIFIFSCLSVTFLRDAKSLVIAEVSLNAAARTERALHNRIEVRKYRRAPTAKKAEPTPKAESKPPVPEKKNKTSIDYRGITPPPEPAKLNLKPLFDSPSNPSAHIVYQTAARLLTLLYQNTPVLSTPQKKGWEMQLLNALITQYKKRKTCETLADLFPDDPALKEIYYHMLKGTNHYSIENNLGIPPLGDFFTCEEEKKETAFYFYFAPPILLEALFGQKVAREILTVERKPFAQSKTYHILDEAELQEILFKQQAGGGLSAFEPHLSFSKQIPPKEQLTGDDPETGLRITRACTRRR